MKWWGFCVIAGVEHEELYAAELNLLGRSANHTGDVSGFAPPGDIHRVHNTGDETAISIHVYGTDVTRVGSSARRYYHGRSSSQCHPRASTSPPSPSPVPARARP